MRLIHTSDWHLGRSFHGQPLLEDQRAFLRWLAATAVERQADLVMVSGDVYDRAVPPVEAVRALDEALTAFAEAGVRVMLVSGNHDSAIRLGFGGGLAAAAGVHLRTSLDTLAEPVIVADEHGPVGIYGIPYLVPDAVLDHPALAAESRQVERSHASVLAAAVAAVQADARARGLARTVVAAHAFVTGAAPSDSERDIRVGGIGDVPASLLAGPSYLALGHLHGPQQVQTGAATVARYAGSPLAFSFSERHHTKSVAVVDLGPDGVEAVELVATPVPRGLAEVTGTIEELVERGRGVDAGLADCWVRAVITDAVRPMSPLDRLREVWPHTVDLDFRPVGATRPDRPVAVGTGVDPVAVCAQFVHEVGGAEPTAGQLALLQAAVEAASRPEEVA